MTPTKRILDMLPALLVFAAVAAFGTYVAVAFVLRDPWWLQTRAELLAGTPPAAVVRTESAPPAPAPPAATER